MSRRYRVFISEPRGRGYPPLVELNEYCPKESGCTGHLWRRDRKTWKLSCECCGRKHAAALQNVLKHFGLHGVSSEMPGR